MSYTTTRSGIRQALRDAATRYGLNPDWLEALGETETNLRPASNLTGPDGARGGSYGPTQISQQTARAFGFTGDMDTLNSDPAAAADLTASMVADGFAERSGVAYHFGPPSSFEDMCAVWNAGRLFEDLPVGGSTLAEYLPRARSKLDAIQGAA